MKKLKEFFNSQIWLIDEKSVSRTRFFIIRQLRVILIAMQGFVKDKCADKASALTYYSLLSIVPVLAMAFGIAKGFGFELMLEEMLRAKFSDKKEILDQVFDFANSFLAHTQGGVVAGVGLVVLFYSVMKVLNNIELSFNHIWQVKTMRRPVRMLSDYFSIMLLAPILFILSNSATIYISAEINRLATEIVFIHHFGIIISFMLKLLPFSLVWLLFALVYMIMPNTRVTFGSAFAGGIIAGIIFQILQFIYFRFQVGVASYNAIYGSFAALPLFLVWMQMSWLIVMLGAEISFAVQNVSKYEFEANTTNMSQKLKIILSITLMQAVVKRFRDGEKAQRAIEIAQEINLPVRIVRSLLSTLNEAGLISTIRTENPDVYAYQPAMDIHTITVHKVKMMLENQGAVELPGLQPNQLTDIENRLHAFDLAAENTDSNVLLLDIQ